ncbi:MAG: DEAD/DEAH box helicase [Treponema sp.]|jgi:ATP-dependent RNA helicase RhlB|nr:DEAD/DEAH box helicase [Treponema sp.]
MEFSELQLHQDLLRGIADAGYVNCMPVQEQVLANAFGGQDLYVQSQTGTGKTAAFLIVIFQRLLAEPLLGGKKALIMTPTRELAVQVEEEARALGKYLPFKTGSFYGGVGYTQQYRLLQDNVQILVGTPGRVLDLNKSGRMNLMDLAFLVIDEADRMFDMGFYPDLRKLIKVVPPADRRQTMLFSATLNSRVKNLAWEYTKTPREIEIEPETVTVDEVEQILYHVHSNDKMRLLLGIMEREKPESAIIFCNTKRYAEIIAKRLRVNGIDCEFIIGDLPQVKRLKIIDDVKSGVTRVLVATDVAARGLDIENLALVVNYDLPAEAENYVHRIGRTARAGKTGKAVTLASEQDVYELPPIERYIGKKIDSQIAGEDLFAADKSEGLKIRTDFYDDRDSRHGGRDGRGTGERRGRRETGGRSGGGREAGGRRPARTESPGTGEGRAGEKSRTGERKPGERTESGRSGPEAGNRRVRETGQGGTSRSGTGRTGTNREEQRRSGRSPEQRRPEQRKAEQRRDDPRLSDLSFEQRMTYYKEKYGEGQNNRDSRAESKQRPAGRSRDRSGGRPKGREHGEARPESRQSAAEAQKTEKDRIEAGTPEKKQGLIGKLMGIFGKKKEN